MGYDLWDDLSLCYHDTDIISNLHLLEDKAFIYTVIHFTDRRKTRS